MKIKYIVSIGMEGGYLPCSVYEFDNHADAVQFASDEAEFWRDHGETVDKVDNELYIIRNDIENTTALNEYIMVEAT